jgi:hypothetical protein
LVPQVGHEPEEDVLLLPQLAQMNVAEDVRVPVEDEVLLPPHVGQVLEELLRYADDEVFCELLE